VERRRAGMDHLLFNFTLALLVIGIVMVYDASYAQSLERKLNGNDGFFFLKKQIVYAIIGLGAMVATLRYGYWKLRALAVPLLLLSLGLLIAVYIPGIGLHKNGAARWIGRGSFQFQPSELAKLAVIIYLAGLLSRAIEGRPFDIRNFVDGLLAPLLVVGVVVMLIEREPDMGTAAVLSLTALTMFWLAGARKTHLIGIIAFGGAAFVLLSMLHGFRQDRFKSYIDPEWDPTGKSMQTLHSLIAVGTGNVKGIGFGAGREKYYLPEANTDFIFATIAEETGLWGSLGVITLLCLIGWRATVIARRTRDTFGAMLASGIAALISWQALINIGVVTNTIPATGVPLPFISFGGTSLVFMLVSVGILLNIAQHPEGRAERVKG
jgi:cell division protein FtsW